MTVKYEIEIPDGVIPEGWEPVAFRVPERGEMLFVSNRNVEPAPSGCVCPRLIFRPVWTPPDWLLATWIAMDAGGLWYGFDDEPRVSLDFWFSPSGRSIRLTDGLLKFDPPSCNDWRQSKRRIHGIEARNPQMEIGTLRQLLMEATAIIDSMPKNEDRPEVEKRFLEQAMRMLEQ